MNNIQITTMPKVALKDFLLKHNMNLIVNEVRPNCYEAKFIEYYAVEINLYDAPSREVCGIGNTPHSALKDFLYSISGVRVKERNLSWQRLFSKKDTSIKVPKLVYSDIYE